MMTSTLSGSICKALQPLGAIKWRHMTFGTAAVLCAWEPALASYTAPVSIGAVYVEYDANVAMVTPAGPAVSWATCATTQRYAISLSTPGGQAAYATILTAKANGTKLAFYGMNTCDVWFDSETLQYVSIPN